MKNNYKIIVINMLEKRKKLTYGEGYNEKINIRYVMERRLCRVV
jgi:hypothetical protein